MTKRFLIFGTLSSILSSATAHALDVEQCRLPCADIHTISDANTLSLNTMDIRLGEHLYHIQPETSKLKFRVDSPLGDIWASFDEFEGGFAMLDEGVHTDPAFVDVNVDSLDTDSGFIGLMMKSESFFDSDNFPLIRFAGSSLEWFSERKAVLKGYMTIQHVTRPVAFYVELVDSFDDDKYAGDIRLRASTTIRRSEFGMYTLLPIVSDNVNLYMCIDARKVDVDEPPSVVNTTITPRTKTRIAARNQL